MKKMMFVMMFVLCTATMACIEDGAAVQQSTPDTTEPDAPQPPADCPPDEQPPAPTLTVTAYPMTITSGESTTVSWTSTNTEKCWSTGGDQPTAGSWTDLHPTTTTTYSLACKGLDGSTVDGSVTVTVNPVPPPPPTGCTCDDDCNDGRSWTGDACNTATGTCVHWATDCGGMQVRPASNTADCQFWAGFGTSEPAPSLGKYSPSSLSTGPSGGSWKAAPAHACSVICYNPGSDVETTVDIQIEWNGTSLQHQEIDGLHKGTWDGKNLRY